MPEQAPRRLAHEARGQDERHGKQQQVAGPPKVEKP
jgi:hypothetical protein